MILDTAYKYCSGIARPKEAGVKGTVKVMHLTPTPLPDVRSSRGEGQIPDCDSPSPEASGEGVGREVENG